MILNYFFILTKKVSVNYTNEKDLKTPMKQRVLTILEKICFYIFKGK